MLREIGEGDDERDPLRRLKSLGAAVLDKMLEPEFVKLQRNQSSPKRRHFGTWHGRQGSLGFGLHQNLRENYRAGANGGKLQTGAPRHHRAFIFLGIGRRPLLSGTDRRTATGD